MSGVAPSVLYLQDIPSRDRGGGLRTIPLVTRRNGATGFTSGYTLFPPLGEVERHSHNCDESIVILEGRAVASIAGVDYELRPGDATFIPAGVPHFFRNMSATEGMKILWTYASVDPDRTLTDTGETRSIDSEHHAPIVSG